MRLARLLLRRINFPRRFHSTSRSAATPSSYDFLAAPFKLAIVFLISSSFCSSSFFFIFTFFFLSFFLTLLASFLRRRLCASRWRSRTRRILCRVRQNLANKSFQVRKFFNKLPRCVRIRVVRNARRIKRARTLRMHRNRRLRTTG